MGVMIMEELREVIEVRRMRDRVMVVVLVFEEDVLSLICGQRQLLEDKCFHEFKMSVLCIAKNILLCD